MKVRFGVLVALSALLPLTAACSSAYVKSPTPKSSVPTLSVGATNADSGAVVPSPQITDASVSQAPLCAAAASCAALDGAQIPLGCVKKVPYTNVLVPQGTTFEVLDQTGDFSCIDSGVIVGDKDVITCHGKELYSFQLRLSNPSCADNTLAVGTGQCEDGYGYDATAKCCAPVTPGSAGSTTVTINLGGCPLPTSP